jgi:hypothetical protein
VKARIEARLRLLWLRVREWSGDLAYETYLARLGEGVTPLSREDFYLDALGRRYRGPSRCC